MPNISFLNPRPAGESAREQGWGGIGVGGLGGRHLAVEVRGGTEGGDKKWILHEKDLSFPQFPYITC